MTKTKKFIFPGTTLLISFYLSALFALGMIIGYLGTALFHKKFITEKNLVIFNWGRWKIHFHHWLMGVSILFGLWMGGWLPLIPEIGLGALGGFMFHDLHLDRKWHKIFLKK
jgi:hypothetical protein